LIVDGSADLPCGTGLGAAWAANVASKLTVEMSSSRTAIRLSIDAVSFGVHRMPIPNTNVEQFAGFGKWTDKCGFRFREASLTESWRSAGADRESAIGSSKF
jgi:hypothetical protein